MPKLYALSKIDYDDWSTKHHAVKFVSHCKRNLLDKKVELTEQLTKEEIEDGVSWEIEDYRVKLI